MVNLIVFIFFLIEKIIFLMSFFNIRTIGDIKKDKDTSNILYVILSGVNSIFKKNSKNLKKISKKRSKKNERGRLRIKKYNKLPLIAPKN